MTYPTTAPEIVLPELDGKTAKMYRCVDHTIHIACTLQCTDARVSCCYSGGKICLTDHFKPLWARNVPHFGIAHALALGV